MKIRLAGLCALIAAPVVYAQPWPAKPVRVIVPFPAGGTTDVIARTFAPHLSEEYGQQFVVDNRSGAGGTIGAEIAARANPDGYTLAVVTSSYAPNAALYKLPYDPVMGIAPISLISVLPFLLAVHPSVKAGSVHDLLQFARQHPATLNYASPGAGSTPHLAWEWLQQRTRVRFTHVPYKGDAPAIADLLGGQVQALFATELVLGPHIKSGRVRALAVSTARRVPGLPELPSISETIPGYAFDGWAGMWAPGGTPHAIVKRLNHSISVMLKLPEVQARLRAAGGEPTPSTPEGFARIIARDIETWKKVVKDGNIRVN